MRRLFHFNVNKIRRMVCSRSKIENRVYELEANPICPDVVHRLISIHVRIDGLFDGYQGDYWGRLIQKLHL